MEFNDWIVCKELVSRIMAMEVSFPTNLGREETKTLNAIDQALQAIGTNWKGFEAAFLAAMGGE